MKYTSTKVVTLESLKVNPPKPGQWVEIHGMRGQFLGYSPKTGQYFFRLQGPKKWGSLNDCMANHYMRLAAICEGAK